MKHIIIGIGAIAVVALLVGFVLFPMFPLAVSDYRTGLTLDTSADFYERAKRYAPFKDTNWLKGTDTEVFLEEKYIVSWQPDGYSQLVTARADFQYHARARCEGWYCACGYSPGVVIGTYHVTVDYIDIDAEVTRIIDTRDDWWDTDFVYWVRGADSSRYLSGDGHYLPNAQYKYPPSGGMWDDIRDSKWYMPWAEQDGGAKWYGLNTDTIEFKMKGNLIGGLSITVALNYAQKEDTGGIIPCTGFKWHRGVCSVVDDEVYLASGEGEINIESTNSIEIAGTETTPETNIIYTKYVYEEDSPVTISVDAMYSGASLDQGDPGYGKGWSLRIYDSSGSLRDSYPINDDVRGYKIQYSIPSGAFIPNDPNDNEWRVVLMNTLFDQSETRLFVVDSFEKMPGKTTITTDKNRYVQWDTVYVTVKANANPDVGPIDRFKIWATYDSPTSTDYAMSVKNYAAFLISDLTYGASIEFQLNKGDKYVYIRAHAFDDESRAGPEGELTIFSEQVVGNYKVTVTVKSSGSPLADAKVVLGDRTVVTPSDGIADVYVPYGTYDLRVSKQGFDSHLESDILVNSDMEITVNLDKSGEIDLVAIVVALIILFSAIILGIFVMPGNMYLKLLVIILGAVVAIIVYFLLSEGII